MTMNTVTWPYFHQDKLMHGILLNPRLSHSDVFIIETSYWIFGFQRIFVEY